MLNRIGRFVGKATTATVAGVLIAATVGAAHASGREEKPNALPGVVLNGRIAFWGSSGDISTTDPGGHFRTNLTNTPGVTEMAPTWSPDGRRIVYETGDNDIWVMNSDGSGQTQLTTSATYDTDPSWSADGTKIIYSSSPTGPNRQIFEMNADGTDQHQLTNDGLVDGTPRMSPDGQSLVFAQLSGGVWDLVLSDSSGNSEQVLTSSGNNLDPGWSPDGSRIVFWSDRTGNRDLYTMTAIGTSQTDITNTSDEERNPVWSPDGQQIAFTLGPVGNRQIATINTDGSGFKQVSFGSQDLGETWQPIVCTKVGTSGNDKLSGTSGNDVLCGLGGNDKIQGKGGDDIIYGGTGNDHLLGGPGNDNLNGGDGHDVMKGAAGNDFVDGADGIAANDRLYGNSGVNTWTADPGDRLVGLS